MFSYLYLNCWQIRGGLLHCWNNYQKLNIAINWFSDNVQSGMFVAEHVGLIKVNKNLKECLSWCKLKEGREKSFLGKQEFGDPYCSSISKQHCIQYWARNIYPFPSHIANPVPTFRNIYLDSVVWKENLLLFFCTWFIKYQNSL